MRVMTVVGARPEFVQMQPVSRAIRTRHEEILVHTGQHFDDNMSAVFFAELDLARPDYDLDVGPGSHGQQTGRMLERLESVMQKEEPDWVLVFGDTNSTVAGALSAAKLHVPIAHVEAGLRSFDRRMPEEVNRVVTDHMSAVLLAPTRVAVENLKREGLTRDVFLVGDVRVDVLRHVAGRAGQQLPALLERAQLGQGEKFALATLHRPSNTDDRERLSRILTAFASYARPIVLPVHPRLGKRMREHGLDFPDNVRPLEPLGFLAMVALLDASELVVTDSGGLQKEAYMLARPTITLRDTTEWVETIDAGWNRLCEPEVDAFARAVEQASTPPLAHPELYGAPGVGDRIVTTLEEHPHASEETH